MKAYPALGHAAFRAFFFAGFVSNVGTWMQNFARSWILYRMTHDPRWLGWLGLSFAVPMVILPPFGGAIVDRAPRVRLLMLTQIALATVALVLAALAWTNVLRPWHLLASSAVGASFLAIDNPARQAIAPDLVPREHLMNALSLNAVSFSGAALIGPALAGAWLVPLGAGSIFFVNAVSYVVMIIAIASQRDLISHAARHTKTARDPLVFGFVDVMRSKLVGGLLLASCAFAIFGRSYPALLPIFADDVWHVGARGYGNFLTAGGAGALLGGFGAASIPVLRASRGVVLAAGLALAASLASFSISLRFEIAIATLVAAAASATVITAALATMLQHAVPTERRGRAMSVYVVTLIGLPQLVAPVLTEAAARAGDHGKGAAMVVLECAAILGVGVLLALARTSYIGRMR